MLAARRHTHCHPASGLQDLSLRTSVLTERKDDCVLPHEPYSPRSHFCGLTEHTPSTSLERAGRQILRHSKRSLWRDMRSSWPCRMSFVALTRCCDALLLDRVTVRSRCRGRRKCLKICDVCLLLASWVARGKTKWVDNSVRPSS